MSANFADARQRARITGRQACRRRGEIADIACFPPEVFLEDRGVDIVEWLRVEHKFKICFYFDFLDVFSKNELLSSR